MQLVIELQGIGVFKFVGQHLEFGMVRCEAVNDFGVTALGARGLEQDAALVRAIIEC